MSALDDLKAAVAKNDVGIAHVRDLLLEAADKLKSDPEGISSDEIETIAEHLSEAADGLQGMTLLAPQASGVPGSTTANQAPSVTTGTDVSQVETGGNNPTPPVEAPPATAPDEPASSAPTPPVSAS